MTQPHTLYGKAFSWIGSAFFVEALAYAFVDYGDPDPVYKIMKYGCLLCTTLSALAATQNYKIAERREMEELINSISQDMPRPV